MHRYCYHITDGITRSALICGTVSADSMEEAAEIAASRAKLTRLVEEDVFGSTTVRWVKDGKPRNVYVLHDPKR